MELNEIRDAVHENSKNKGFWDDYFNSATCGYAVMQAFLAQKLMLTVSELGEALEALRDDHFANKEQFELEFALTPAPSQEEFRVLFQKYLKNTFEDELADALIRICDLAAIKGIDIDYHVQRKMEYNGMRPHKHGRNF